MCGLHNTISKPAEKSNKHELSVRESTDPPSNDKVQKIKRISVTLTQIKSEKIRGSDIELTEPLKLDIEKTAEIFHIPLKKLR